MYIASSILPMFVSKTLVGLDASSIGDLLIGSLPKALTISLTLCLSWLKKKNLFIDVIDSFQGVWVAMF